MKKRFLTGIIVITAVMLVCLTGCGLQEAIEKKAKDKLGAQCPVNIGPAPTGAERRPIAGRGGANLYR